MPKRNDLACTLEMLSLIKKIMRKCKKTMASTGQVRFTQCQVGSVSDIILIYLITGFQHLLKTKNCKQHEQRCEVKPRKPLIAKIPTHPAQDSTLLIAQCWITEGT